MARGEMFTVGPELLDHIGEWADIPAAVAGTVQLRSARAVNTMTWEVGYRDSDGKTRRPPQSRARPAGWSQASWIAAKLGPSSWLGGGPMSYPNRAEGGWSRAIMPDVDETNPQFYSKVPRQFLYTKRQAAAALAMSTRSLDELLRAAKICAVQDGRIVKFTPAELQAYADSLPSWEPPWAR